MDWFEKLTGFGETGYDETRARLEVEGEHYAHGSTARAMESASLNLFHFRLSANGQQLQATCLAGSRRVW